MIRPILGKPALPLMNVIVDPVEDTLLLRSNYSHTAPCYSMTQIKHNKETQKFQVRLRAKGKLPRTKTGVYRLICPEETVLNTNAIKDVPLCVFVKFPMGTMGIILGGNKKGVRVNTTAVLGHETFNKLWKHLVVYLKNKQGRTVKIKPGTSISNLILVKNTTPALAVELPTPQETSQKN